MDGPSVQELCEIASGVPPEGAALLRRVGSHLPLLAEVAGADLTLLVPAAEPGRLLVLTQGRPTAVRTLYPKPRTGDIVAEEQEPAAGRCLRRGRSQRSPYACVLAGRPVEQVVLPVRDAGRAVVAALSVERSLLNGLWLPARRPLRNASEGIAAYLLQGALEARDVLSLLRMGRGIAVAEAGGEVLYADEAARKAWAQALGGGRVLSRLPAGAPPQSTVLSRGAEVWGPEWEFDVGGTVFRRRDIRLGGGESSNVLTTIADVSHLHAGQWMVSTRSAAFQEVHHRIKNNLQTISSLLRMQARRETSERARDSLRTAIGRVQSVAFVHEALSLDGADEVDLKALASTLADAAVHDVQRGRGAITSTVVGPRLLIPAARATQVALVLNEAIQNAVKHAFPDERPGSLTVRFDQSPTEITIVVQDDGVGLADDFALARTQTLGLQIAKAIVESDLGGTLALACDGGTSVTMRLPGSLAHQEADAP
jgi:two-component sensor histidine kinase